MARLLKPYAQYDSLTIQDLQDPIVFVVDMVNGFVKEGVLHDCAIQAILLFG